MTAALIALAVSTVLSPALCLYTVTRYLAGRDAQEARDRQVWANRVQAPETAVVQTLEPPAPPEVKRPDTEASELAAYEETLAQFSELTEV